MCIHDTHEGTVAASLEPAARLAISFAAQCIRAVYVEFGDNYGENKFQTEFMEGRVNHSINGLTDNMLC